MHRITEHCSGSWAMVKEPSDKGIGNSSIIPAKSQSIRYAAWLSALPPKRFKPIKAAEAIVD